MNSSTSSFKTFLVRFLLPFLLVTGGVGLLFSFFFEKEIILNSEICGAYKINRIIKETHPDEIPIFGSSRAEGGYIPSILGPTYFNYGLEGTGTSVMLFFLKEECKKKKTTPYVIVNFDLTGFDHQIGDISNYIYNSDYLPVRQLLGKQYKTSFAIPFVKYYGQYEPYLKYYMNNKISYTKYTDKGASVEKNKITKGELNKFIEEGKQIKSRFVLKDTALKNEYVRLINSNPQRIFIFVIAPYLSSISQQIKNLPEVGAFLSDLRKYKNVKVFDFSGTAYPDSLFINTSHINYDGAVRFTTELRDSIKTISNKE